MDNNRLNRYLFSNCAKEVASIANVLLSYITISDYKQLYRASPDDEEVKKTVAIIFAYDDELIENLYQDYHNHLIDDYYDNACEICQENKTIKYFEEFVLKEINKQ
jgi:predicted transcriptional regulator